MKIVFFGSSAYSIEVLKELIFLEYKSLHVVTRSDKPKGRGKKVTPTEVKAFSQENNIPVMTPHDLNDPEFLQAIRDIKPDIFLIASYGKFLPQELLDIARLPLCLHPSLLPKYRGAAPVNWALINGETETGVSLFKVVKKMDAGDVLFAEKIEISPSDDSHSLFQKVFILSNQLLEKALPLIKAGKISMTPQDVEKVTFAPKIDKQMLKLDWSLPYEKIVNLTRGLTTYGCTWSSFRGKRVKFWKIDQEDLYCQLDGQCSEATIPTGQAGEIVYVDKHHMKIATVDGIFIPLVVQPEGKHKMDVTDFISGFHPNVGELFE